mgnify:CR=1 FL=1
MDEKDIVCAICSSEAVKKVTGTFQTTYNQIPISLRAVERYRCTECSEEFLTPGQAKTISKQVKAIAREHLGLLPPDRIIAIRQQYGLSQEGLEALLGLGSKVVTRWETARVLQTKAADDLLRLMERLPAVVEALREIRALAAGEAQPSPWPQSAGQSSASAPRLGRKAS